MNKRLFETIHKSVEKSLFEQEYKELSTSIGIQVLDDRYIIKYDHVPFTVSEDGQIEFVIKRSLEDDQMFFGSKLPFFDLETPDTKRKYDELFCHPMPISDAMCALEEFVNWLKTSHAFHEIRPIEEFTSPTKKRICIIMKQKEGGYIRLVKLRMLNTSEVGEYLQYMVDTRNETFGNNYSIDEMEFCYRLFD